MKAIVVRQTGDPDALQLEDVDVPAPGPQQVRIKTAATGVNFIETYQRSGIYQMATPFTPGGEAAGTIDAVGDKVTDLRVGQKVATAQGVGAYAQYMLIDADKALPVPDELDLQVAAALPLQGMTAHYLCNSTYPVSSGQTVLVHAGAGGVGLLLTQLLKAKGATVITTVSTPEKAELSRGAGADHVLNYENFADKVHELTHGEGLPVVFDGVGASTFDDSLRCLQVRGTMVLFGAASGPVPDFDIQRLNSGGSLYLTRPSMAHYLRTADERRWRAREIFDAVLAGTLNARIGATYPLAEAAQAHTDLQGRKTTGKVLLVP